MKLSHGIYGLTLAYVLLLMVQACQTGTNNTVTLDPKPSFTGAESCKSCHAEAYASWQTSDHYQAMQPATDSTVLGDFNNVVFKGDGVTSTFFRKDGKFIIQTEGPDGRSHDYEVLYTFGYYPLQQYLIAFPGGRMQATRVSWDSRDHKWFNQYAGQQIDHRDWLHWTGNSQNWNTMCASCHSTDLQKNYDEQTDTYQTTWKEINVTCESCHGPGSNHIAFVNSTQYKKGARIENAGLSYGRDTVAQKQLNTCAACHARKSDVAREVIRSGEILDDLIPQVITDELYFADGQIKEEDYEYGSFTQSKMFHNNVRCSQCHNPHSGKLRLTGNNLCLQCHKPSYNATTHHFHQMDTEAALCINCHMVTRTYMGVDHRRDHSFRIPRPDQSVAYGTPNACNGCHSKETSEWAAEKVRSWYGPERKYHFSDDLIPGSLLNGQSEGHLVKLLGDTTQPEIARATAASYLGNLQTMGSAQALLGATNDKKALVRYHAIRSLENFPADVWVQKVYPALKDSVRAVRIAAADLYHRLPEATRPSASKDAFLAADRENKDFLNYQTDFAVGNVMMADYMMQGGAYPEAIRYYRRGLKMDSLMNYARLNLSAAYNTLGKNEEALQTLQDAAQVDPFNDHIFYNLALLQHEMGATTAALDNFRKAVNLGSVNPGVYYNYGLLLVQQGDYQSAEKILLRGLALQPQSANINYALAYLYIRLRQPQKALPYGQMLKTQDPQNPEYGDLFRSLGL